MGPQASQTGGDEQHHPPPLGPSAGAACQELLLEDSTEIRGQGAACKMPGGAVTNRLHDAFHFFLLTPWCHEAWSRTCFTLTPAG